jgi:membrane protein
MKSGGPLRERLRSLTDLFSKAFDRYDDLEGIRLGAAFSYYATFAIFPLILLTLTVVGFVIGDDAATRDRLLSSLGSSDASVHAVLEQTLTSMQGSSGARKASAIVGIATLLVSASGAFVELDFSLNKIWQCAPRTGHGIVGKVGVFVRERLSGFACVLAIGLFMLVSLIVTAALGLVAKHTPYASFTPALLRALELAVSLGLLSLAFGAAFHFIPRSRPPFREVIGGAAVTTVLLTLLKAVFALYLAHLTSYSAYGVAGGVLALATWIYLSAQVIFFGATLTRVHCELTGPLEMCAFKIADACQAKGICVRHTGEGTCDASARQVCACDGTTTALRLGCDLPKGYELIPIVNAGPCADVPR